MVILNQTIDNLGSEGDILNVKDGHARNYLIPKREELQRRSEGVMSNAVIKDKKYRGGLVVEPKEGIHFDVVVMDFASLYPSIIKVRKFYNY